MARVAMRAKKKSGRSPSGGGIVCLTCLTTQTIKQLNANTRLFIHKTHLTTNLENNRQILI